MWVLAVALGGSGDADQGEEFERPLAPGRPPGRAVDDQRLLDLMPDADEWVQRNHRLLEDHRHRITSKPAHLRLGCGGKVRFPKQNPAACDQCVGRQQSHHRQGRQALATPALAHQSQYLSTPDLEGNVRERSHPAAAQVKVHREFTDIEQRCLDHPRGSSAGFASTRN